MTETLALHFHILVPFKKKFNSNQVSSYNIKFPSQITKKAFNFLYFAQSILFFYIKRILFKYDENEKRKSNFSVILYRYHSEKVYLHQL